MTRYVLAALFVFSFNLSAKTWVDTKGRRLDAEFVRQDQRSVMLRKNNGTVFSVLKKSVVENNQRFLANLNTGGVLKKVADPTGNTGDLLMGKINIVWRGIDFEWLSLILCDLKK